jgi:hypothetical protein
VTGQRSWPGNRVRRELVAVTLAVVVVAAAFAVPYLHLGIVTPLFHGRPLRIPPFSGTAPIFGWWDPHTGWGSIAAVIIGAAGVCCGPAVAARLSWRAMIVVTWLTSLSWAFALAMVDGWQRGFAGRLMDRDEYLRQVPSISDIPQAVRTFSSRILDSGPNSWITQVSGHPPGALLTFVWLDRIGLGGGAWGGVFCVLIGSSAAVAVIVTVRALVDEATARGGAIRFACAHSHLDRGVRRRLLHRRRLMGHRTPRVVSHPHNTILVGFRGVRRTAARMVNLPQLRPHVDGAARTRGSDSRAPLARSGGHTGVRGAGCARGRRGVRLRGFLVA